MARVLEGEFGRTEPGLRLELIGVRGAERGHGIGQQLFDALTNWARRHGIRDIRTQAPWNNSAMLRWIDAMGFVLAPQQVGDITTDLVGGTGPGLSPYAAKPNVLSLFGNGAPAQPGSELETNLIGTCLGRWVLMSNNVPDMNTAADHGGALISPRYALKGAVAWMPQTGVYDQGVNAQPATSFFHTVAYAVTEGQDLGIVTIISKHA
jgi:hypothetical protein